MIKEMWAGRKMADDHKVFSLPVDFTMADEGSSKTDVFGGRPHPDQAAASTLSQLQATGVSFRYFQWKTPTTGHTVCLAKANRISPPLPLFKGTYCVIWL